MNDKGTKIIDNENREGMVSETVYPLESQGVQKAKVQVFEDKKTYIITPVINHSLHAKQERIRYNSFSEYKLLSKS